MPQAVENGRPEPVPLGKCFAALGNREDRHRAAVSGVASIRGPLARELLCHQPLEESVLDLAFIAGIIALVVIVAIVGRAAEKL
jgi:hypothetical protein